MKHIIFFLLFAVYSASYSQDLLKNQIQQITKSKRAKVGVAILDLTSKETLTIHEEGHFAMQSVYKFHLALAVLNEVDKGKLSLNQKIYVSKTDIRPDTWSPLREKYPNGDINITVGELLTYTVGKSDNNGCDILFKLLGGTKAVNKYIHDLGIKDIEIVATEAEMHAEWNVQYSNYCTPLSAIKLMEKFHENHILSKSSQDFLWKTMVETTTGATKIKALLPKAAMIAHKSGWSGSNKNGLTGATNDIGIVTLPNGKQYAIAVFVANSMENETTNDGMIAEISKVTWDYFLSK